MTGTSIRGTDPNIIAPLTIERVEVLPDGASSTYGSDAVAGVINFITRRHFKGVEVSGQYGFGQQFNTQDAGFLWGDATEASSAMLSYNYSRRSAISDQDRPFTRANHIPQRGGNFATFNCAPASVQPAGSSLVYGYPYTGTGVTNNANNVGHSDRAWDDSRVQSMYLEGIKWVLRMNDAPVQPHPMTPPPSP